MPRLPKNDQLDDTPDNDTPVNKDWQISAEPETFIKIRGQEYAYKAINIVRTDLWISFDRVNTKTGLVAGHLEFPMSSVESIEKR